MRSNHLLAGVLAAALIAGRVNGATPPSLPGYQVNLGNYPVPPNFVPGQVPMWLDSTAVQTNPDGSTFWTPRPVSDQSGLPTRPAAGSPGTGPTTPTYTAPLPVSITQTLVPLTANVDKAVVAANATRRSLDVFVSPSTCAMSLAFDQAAVVGAGPTYGNAGQLTYGDTWRASSVPSNAIHAITAQSGCTVTVREGN